jgi:hypothetical protein
MDAALKAHKVRCDKAWAAKTPFQTMYDEVYDYVIPFRRPSALGKASQGENRVSHLYDNTAMVSAFAGAGRLQQDLFPPGQPFFTLAFGPLAKQVLKRQKIDIVEAARALEDVAKVAAAFFQTGEFDNACNEMCIDLIAGSGGLLPVEGDDDNPIRFVCPPFDELAITLGPYADISGIFWKTMMSRANIKAAFPRGRFPVKFTENLVKDADAEIELHQDWTHDYAAKRWVFRVWIEEGDADNTFIVESKLRTQPMAIARYHRVPGEAYGRGPGMLALPTAKTLNKAVELMLKAAAIQMLGIWAYRPGGAFNPATARFAPGAFWPMSSTGGVLGADVTRLDPAAAKMEIGQLISTELRQQLAAAMNDDKLPQDGATPKSATEIMARMKRISQNYLGAYGRLVNDIIPVLVKRVIEIAHKRKLIDTPIRIDALLIAVDVTSPMASAMKAHGLQQSLEWLQIIATLKGPQAVELLCKLDDLLADMGERLGVPAEFRMSKAETQALTEKMAQAAAQLAAAQTQAAQAPAAPADPAADIIAAA